MNGNIVFKKYKCKKCGCIKEIETNHYGECYSVGYFNICPKCPPYAKYSEFNSKTTWVCQEIPLSQNEKESLINFLIKDYRRNEGKNEGPFERISLRKKLNKLTDYELSLLKTGAGNGRK